MGYNEDDYLPLSGLQHFAFCRRQWALIHIENQWAENYRTVDGQLMHQRVHDQEFRESRGDRLTVRGLAVHSAKLGVSGQCDAVEFFRDPAGVPLRGREGLWLPYPVEYKRGKPKEHGADELQLCAQAMCLEEMLCCAVPEGALYYGEPRRRTVVRFTPELCGQVRYTGPRVKTTPRKKCVNQDMVILILSRPEPPFHRPDYRRASRRGAGSLDGTSMACYNGRPRGCAHNLVLTSPHPRRHRFNRPAAFCQGRRKAARNRPDMCSPASRSPVPHGAAECCSR